LSKQFKMTLKERHESAFKKLRIEANKKLTNREATQIAAKVGIGVGVSGQTVINYLNGKCKDGFITEALTAEFKKLKPVKL